MAHSDGLICQQGDKSALPRSCDSHNSYDYVFAPAIASARVLVHRVPAFNTDEREAAFLASGWVATTGSASLLSSSGCACLAVVSSVGTGGGVVFAE